MQMLHIGRFFNTRIRHFDAQPIVTTSGLFPFIESLVVFTDHSDILEVQAAKCYVLQVFMLCQVSDVLCCVFVYVLETEYVIYS